ncbi:MAG: XdhC family protein [Pseudomonadales bacterium]
MTATDLLLLEQLRKWLEQGQHCWLCTVIETWGSAPRPVGSLMAFNSAGQIAGSLSGGCVEDDLLQRVLDATPASAPQTIGYGASAEENERLGLPCGGNLKIVVEALAPNEQSITHIAALLAATQQRQCVRRQLDLTTGEFSLQACGEFETLRVCEGQLLHTLGPRYQLLLIGAGELSRMLAQMALAFDYQIIVCDPRQQLIDDWPLEQVIALQGMPDDIVRDYVKDAFSVVLALTHDPRIDDMGLMEALQSPAFYVGALGSKKTAEKRRTRLQQLDLSANAIQRLHAPVGLAIGAKTPAEIAIAILADLVQVRAAQRQHQL